MMTVRDEPKEFAPTPPKLVPPALPPRGTGDSSGSLHGSAASGELVAPADSHSSSGLTTALSVSVSSDPEVDSLAQDLQRALEPPSSDEERSAGAVLGNAVPIETLSLERLRFYAKDLALDRERLLQDVEKSKVEAENARAAVAKMRVHYQELQQAQVQLARGPSGAGATPGGKDVEFRRCVARHIELLTATNASFHWKALTK
jgi:hypothetical protein